MRRVLAHCWRETRPRKEVASKQLMMNQMVECPELYTFWYNFHLLADRKKRKKKRKRQGKFPEPTPQAKSTPLI
jgi:hypothetical protein